MSRSVDRIAPMLAEVERVWRAHPDWRLGQLIGNAARAPQDALPHEYGEYRDPFNVEDGELQRGLERIE